MGTQLDRIEAKIDALSAALTNKQSPFDRKDDGAAPAFVPVDGVEKVLGPKPAPQASTARTIWTNEAKKITKVYTDIPSAYEAGAMKLAAATGVIAVFVDYNGTTRASLRAGFPLWLVDAANFVGSGVEGLIRTVEDAE